MKDTELQEIKRYLQIKPIISISEFKSYLLEQFPNLSEKYYNYYLSELYKNNILYRYDIVFLKTCDGKNDFSFSQVLDDELLKKLESINPSIYICTWQLSDLSNYMSHQSFKNIKLIETYSYATDVVLNTLINDGKKVVMKEDFVTYTKYDNSNELYVIKIINEDSPIVRQGYFLADNTYIEKSHIVAPKIEKIIVDIIIDDLFNTILGDDVFSILRELLRRYKFNMSTIKRYATKKHRWDFVKTTIESTGFDINRGDF